MTDYLSEVFGPSGVFAARFANYQMRSGQVALARTVDQAMRERRHVLAEGPCGSGKSLAYSVPAIYHAHHHKKRVVVTTANIALQERMAKKDLPLLAEILPWTFSFALLKGRNNFACLDAAAEAQLRGGLLDLDDADSRRQMDAIRAWVERTETGDVSELSFVPVPRVWSRVSVSSDECKGDDCPFRDDCFFERAKAAAADADVIVTNYHLLFAHLALRRETGQDLVLPPFDLVVLDEAHEAVEIARDFFGFAVSEHSVTRLARYANDVGERDLADRLRNEAQRVFEEVAAFARSPAYQRRLKRPGFTRIGDLLAALTCLAEHALGRAGDDGLERSSRAAARAASRQATTFASRLADAVAQTDARNVYWIELVQGRARLNAKPVDVSGLLREELFDKAESVTLISATMTTDGTFEFIRREAGVPEDALEVIAETPFDFARQALLIVPDGLPEPRDPAFIDAVAQVLQRVIDLCDGRTLGLFTSHKNLGDVHARIAGNGHRVLRQGELPRAELVRLFQEDVSSILLGTESFWTGVDVAGEALTAVVIDKLPFPSPDDPIVDAISERDSRAFGNYLLPKAIILLRQGVGRLIRSEGDIGVVVILDRRLAEKGYGRRILKSLPPMLTTRRLDNITPFLEEARRARGG